MGVEAALREAASHGYEAIVLVLGVVAMSTFGAFIIKWILKSTEKREERLAARISTLELFVEHTLLGLVKDNGAIMTRVMDAVTALAESLHGRSCLLATETTDRVIDRFADRVGEKVADDFRKKT